MKKSLLLVVMAMAALCAAATDRFYIEDFSISAGETRTVSIMLDNETAYTAFQTDIYLPEGLVLEQEEGDYIFDLTSRKGRDHNIASQVQADGAIRIMSYSPTIKTYSGNSGALVTFNVTASTGFTEPHIIELKNVLFTTAVGTEVTFADETCTVTVPPRLPGDVDGDGLVNISDVTALIDYLLSGDASAIILANADCDGSGNVNITDVTTLIDYLLSGNWPVEPEPEPTPGVTPITVNGVTFNMVMVEGGTFTMGATSEQESDANDNEKPAHEVTLTTDYCIGQTEVTQALWNAVMGSNPSYFVGDLNHPVECVSWNDCQIFITKLNEMTGRQFRLPTEAEWEFAARGGNKSQGYKFSGSNDIDEVAWYKGNIPSLTSGTDGYGTQPVATKAANELGLYDMSGNVWEWCQDWFGSYSAEAQTDPTGPETGNTLVVRGGCWYNSAAKTCRVTRRNGCLTTDNANYLGLRLAMDYTEEYTVNGVLFTMVPVKGGTFTMGATPEQEEQANDNEKPDHEVTLSDYSIGQTEVTQELWHAVMGTNPSRFNDDVNKPVEKISWNECQTFIATLNELTGKNFRLPTEAEWEFAARGGIKSQGYKYSGSDDLNEIAWYNYNAYAVGSSSLNYGTHAVSTKAANELGLYDMTGNVWEWCQDWSGTYSDEPQTNPTGPVTGTTRIIRGGGWTNYPSLLRVAARADYSTSYISNFIGFRLAL